MAKPSPPPTENQRIVTAEDKAAPSEWRPVAEAPIDQDVVGSRTGAWVGALCRFNGVEWTFLSAPELAHSDRSTLNPMLAPTHWKPIKRGDDK